MHFKQYYLGCLAHASYMIADERTGVAAVIDPQRDIDQYLADAAANGWRIQYVFLSHFHADFLAGHIELREKTGAHIYLGARAEAEYDFNPVKEGDVVEFGDVRLKVLETPGHTPEGISLLVYDMTRSDSQPHAVLTGDTLFIGDVGRPDLLASIGVTADELADMLYDSVNRLKELPESIPHMERVRCAVKPCRTKRSRRSASRRNSIMPCSRWIATTSKRLSQQISPRHPTTSSMTPS